MTDDPFDSPRELLDRARDHIKDVDARITEFFTRKTHTRIVDYDRETSQEVHKIRLTAKIPGKMSAITKDAISNLRDCLDHIVYASCVALGREATATKFPFADSGREFEGELWALKEVSPVIWGVIERFRPYKGGNDLLWCLNKIRNTNTHRLIVPVGAAVLGSDQMMSVSGGDGSAEMQIGYHKWIPAKNEVEFLRVPRGTKVQYNVRVSFGVVFSDVEVIGGQPVTRALNAIVREVESVLLAVEAETARLLRCTA